MSYDGGCGERDCGLCRTDWELSMLRAFAQAVMAHYPEDIDGSDLEEIAMRHGMIAPVKVAAPCNDVSCMCAAVGNLPGICYRKTELLSGNARARKGEI